MCPDSVQTINQLLTEMDGFENNQGVVFIAATNRPGVLDDAVVRPGRFDRIIHLSHPNLDVSPPSLSAHWFCLRLPKAAFQRTCSRSPVQQACVQVSYASGLLGTPPSV